ncbi:class I SAM-dependent methyltransferase [Candidatus Campbellbacteria bacterium]|nr:MAG: class I SAM-dependent methyltransferase [Candidatus Campbellbacteria bacterium]
MVYKTKGEFICKEIQQTDVVLDVGFFGQGVMKKNQNWVHALLTKRASVVWGVDIDFDATFEYGENYVKASAESFSIDKKFDVIFAGDLIEHLSNPGLFLNTSAKHIQPHGRLIITTPNCFNLFNITEKISKGEPTVNHDHTCYFNSKTLKQLLEKNGWEVVSVGYIYSLDVEYVESLKKKLLNMLYWILSTFTDVYMETLVVIAQKKI